MGFDPVQRLYCVIVRRWEAMFRCETVFDGRDDGNDVVCEVGAEVVEDGGGCAEENEAATVEVEN